MEIRRVAASESWIRNLFLKCEDRQIPKTSRKLNDCHINAAQQLLKEQFPNIDDLQDPLMSQLSFNPSVNEGIQIHPTEQCHWVTSTSIGDSLSVYDSLYNSLTKSIEVRWRSAILLINEKKILNVDVPSAQVQTGTVDCGVFSIAFALWFSQWRWSQ